MFEMRRMANRRDAAPVFDPGEPPILKEKACFL